MAASKLKLPKLINICFHFDIFKATPRKVRSTLKTVFDKRFNPSTYGVSDWNFLYYITHIHNRFGSSLFKEYDSYKDFLEDHKKENTLVFNAIVPEKIAKSLSKQKHVVFTKIEDATEHVRSSLEHEQRVIAKSKAYSALMEILPFIVCDSCMKVVDYGDDGECLNCGFENKAVGIMIKDIQMQMLANKSKLKTDEKTIKRFSEAVAARQNEIKSQSDLLKVSETIDKSERVNDSF